MSRIILFNKPYGVLSQFTPEHGHHGLGEYIPMPGFYAAGRLDADSEGLLILTDDGALQHRLAHPRHKQAKVYWCQVEGVPDAPALGALRRGVDLGDFITLPARVRPIPEPEGLWPRDPPIRYRRQIPTSWLEITLVEGKNRQVRRMTARVGFPTLRLVRASIGDWSVRGLVPGQWRLLEHLSQPAGRPRPGPDGRRNGAPGMHSRKSKPPRNPVKG